jgi:hypothetical protein
MYRLAEPLLPQQPWQLPSLYWAPWVNWEPRVFLLVLPGLVHMQVVARWDQQRVMLFLV